MASTPDWYTPTSTDITAQTIVSLAIDIVAQTLTRLKIDIDAQTLPLLVMDIASQSIGAINVDLSGQSVGNIAIDIAAQAIGNIEIDIAAQALSELQNRPKYGAAETGTFNVSIGATSEDTLVSMAGSGIIYGGTVYNIDTINHGNDELVIVVDGVEVFRQSPNVAVSAGYTQPFSNYAYLSRHWERLLQYKYIFVITKGITIESSYEILWNNIGADSTPVKGVLIYATI